MSLDYYAIVLEEEKVDALWVVLSRAEEAQISGLMKGAFVPPNGSGTLGAFQYIPSDEFLEIRESIRSRPKDELLVQIAELDQTFFEDISVVKHWSDRSLSTALSIFGESVGLEAISKYGGGEDRVTTEQWIAGFRAFTKEKQDEVKKRLGGEQSEGWREFADEIRPIRDLAKYCLESHQKMLVYVAGDAILTPYFAKRAEAIYSMLESQSK